MFVYSTIDGLREYLNSQKGNKIGFTPTMGALHEGHVSLLRRSKAETAISVVSIFVNPTQFNDSKDLANYPRTLDADLNMLYAEGCDVVFVPDVDEVYPKDETSVPIDLQGLDMSMEGYFRPGHFAGVAQVVKRLLEIVQPDALFMGQKDFQQVAVIRHLIQTHSFPVTLVMCPTLREASGLAMSSRNVRLSEEMRTRAAVIYQTLTFSKEHYDEMSIKDLQTICIEKLQEPGFRPEYYEIVDGITLKPADESTQYVVACCAVWAGDVRLIDNMILREIESR